MKKAALKPHVEGKQCGSLDDTPGWQSKNGWSTAYDAELALYYKARGEFRNNQPPSRSAPATSLQQWAMLMWVWARRVRRDILVLEAQLRDLPNSPMKQKIKQNGQPAGTQQEYDIDFYDDPGDPPPPPDEEGLF